MGTTTYRRRVAGRGSRLAGKRRTAGLADREKRRLLQLGASLVLFLLVFVGRGIFPVQMEAIGEALNSDLDFSKAISAFGREMEEQNGLTSGLDLLISFFSGDTGEAEQKENAAPEVSLTIPTLPPYSQRLKEHKIPEDSSDSSQTAETPEETEQPDGEPTEEEPVVTAVAQLYSADGEALPERVSYEYYNLGLEEMVVPAMGAITSGFGFRDHPVSGDYSFHTAVDVAVDVGTEILAFADGAVRYIGESDVFGLYVKVDHDNGVSTFYAHCDELLVSKGDEVAGGQVIALSGETGNATGPHLHFSLEKDGIRLDPEYYLEFEV